MSALARSLRLIAAWYLSALIIAGCGTTTITPAFRPTGGLPHPDRVLVFDFAVTPAETGIDRGVGWLPQTEEDVQVGKAVARSLSVNLVQELRSRSIDAYHATETAPPGETTASIRGSFLREDRGSSTVSAPVGFTLGSSHVRLRVQFFQGTGYKLQLVGEGETVTPNSLKPGIGALLSGARGTAAAGATSATSEGSFTAVEADAKRIAQAVAERVANYYRQEGWIKP